MTNTTQTTAIEVADKYAAKISSALETLSAKIGVGVDHFWPVFVKQQVFEAYSGIIGSMIIIAVFTVSLYLIKKYWHWRNDEDASCALVIIMIIAFFSGLFSCFAFGSIINDHIPAIFNPEYQAVKDIGTLIK